MMNRFRKWLYKPKVSAAGQTLFPVGTGFSAVPPTPLPLLGDLQTRSPSPPPDLSGSPPSPAWCKPLLLLPSNPGALAAAPAGCQYRPLVLPSRVLRVPSSHLVVAGTQPEQTPPPPTSGFRKDLSSPPRCSGDDSCVPLLRPLPVILDPECTSRPLPPPPLPPRNQKRTLSAFPPGSRAGPHICVFPGARKDPSLPVSGAGPHPTSRTRTDPRLTHLACVSLSRAHPRALNPGDAPARWRRVSAPGAAGSEGMATSSSRRGAPPWSWVGVWAACPAPPSAAAPVALRALRPSQLAQGSSSLRPELVGVRRCARAVRNPGRTLDFPGPNAGGPVPR
ncbi:hypothetical protein MJG53_005636 [Ovis ammon polii x Ovis aries]|uniref:Uncharacterized protein n=1 Tax=Ovis ammon polii x Ovis aries TaxID=2918886 RepID=A0ACB9V6L7_9CETA|nr:hypothetical protein MJG53_005636 [Ovis ammon polii x Ovis aries]